MPRAPIRGTGRRWRHIGASDDQDAAIYLTAALTGLRRGELLGLRWRDIDFPGQAIGVRANLSYGQIVTPDVRQGPRRPHSPDSNFRCEPHLDVVRGHAPASHRRRSPSRCGPRRGRAADRLP
jgi:integrase